VFGWGCLLFLVDFLFEVVVWVLCLVVWYILSIEDVGLCFVVSELVATLVILCEVVRVRVVVWIGYVDGNGWVEWCVVELLLVEGGKVMVFDYVSEEVCSFFVYWVIGVVLV